MFMDKRLIITHLYSGGVQRLDKMNREARKKMKKVKMLLLGSLLAVCNIASAQWVEVTGVGEDKDSALRDAKRNAVEQVVGTYINSETLVSQASVVQDEIYAKATGFVTDVKVVNEGRRGEEYSVRANINVNTNPNSELMNRVEMIRALGDPRIGVVVTYYGDIEGVAREKYPLMCEAAINNKLAELGFTHIISSNIVLNNKNIDRYLAADAQKLLPDKSLDFLIIGKLDLHTGNISLPQYEKMSEGSITFNTGLVNSLAEINIDIYKASTGEIINSFNVESHAIQNSDNTSANASIKLVGTEAASKIKQALSRKAASVDNQMQLHIEAHAYDDVLEISKALKSIAGVSNVREQNYNNSRSIITVATTLKPQTVFRMLRDKLSFDIFIENVTANNMKIKTK